MNTLDEVDAKQFIATRVQSAADAYLLLGGTPEIAAALRAHVGPKGWIAIINADHADSLTLHIPREREFRDTDVAAFRAWFQAFLVESQPIVMCEVKYPPGVKEAPEVYEAFRREIETLFNRQMVEMSTLVRFAESMDVNCMKNLPANARATGVKHFEGLLKGMPAVIVGAGPSLSSQMDALKAAQGKAAILAVTKPLKLLLKNEVRPDFIVHLDMLKESAACMEGFDIPPGIPLVYDPDAYPSIPAQHTGPLITYESHIHLNKWASLFMGEKGLLPKGLSVAHTAFFFARHMGCDPIVLLGVDCAFPGERTHADGVTMTWGGNVKDGTNQQWIEIQGVDGKPVRSLPVFQSFVTAFEAEIPRTQAKLVQASPNGAYIRGAEHKSLAEVMAGRGTCDLVTTIPGAMVPQMIHWGGRFQAESDTAIRQMSLIIAACDKGLTQVNRLRHLDPTNKLEAQDYDKALKRMEQARHDLNEQQIAKNLLERLLSGTAFEMKKLTREIEFDGKRDGRLIDLQEVMYKGFRDCALFWLREYEPVRKRLEVAYGR